jgi:hypothetical protein
VRPFITFTTWSTHNGTIHNGAIHNGTIHNGAIHNGTIHNGTRVIRSAGVALPTGEHSD